MNRPATLAAAAAVAAALGAAAWAAPPPPTPTRDFVQAAAQFDQFEILEGRVATVEGRDPRVRAFAQQMIEAHMGTTEALGRAAASAGLPPPPPSLSGDQAMLLGALQAQRGPEFDKTYVRHQVLGHQQALVVEQGYADGGADTSVRAAARAAVPLIRGHLDMARQLCAAMGCDS